MSDPKEVADLVARLNHLVSLNEPANGGPYGGYAAVEFVKAASAAAATLQSLSADLERVTAERDEARDRQQKAETALLISDETLQFASVKLGGPDEWTDQETMIYSVRETAEAAEARISTLTEALEPFAFTGMSWRHGDSVQIRVTVQSIERARAALGTLPPTKQGEET